MNLREEFQDEIRLARLEEEREARTLESEIDDYADEARDLRRQLEKVTADLAEALESNTSLRRRNAVQGRQVGSFFELLAASVALRDTLTTLHGDGNLPIACHRWRQALAKAEGRP